MLQWLLNPFLLWPMTSKSCLRNHAAWEKLHKALPENKHKENCFIKMFFPIFFCEAEFLDLNLIKIYLENAISTLRYLSTGWFLESVDRYKVLFFTPTSFFLCEFWQMITDIYRLQLSKMFAQKIRLCNAKRTLAPFLGPVMVTRMIKYWNQLLLILTTFKQ